jgi:hypothetical protein
MNPAKKQKVVSQAATNSQNPTRHKNKGKKKKRHPTQAPVGGLQKVSDGRLLSLSRRLHHASLLLHNLWNRESVW